METTKVSPKYQVVIPQWVREAMDKDPGAAARLVQRVFRHVEQLEAHPKSGRASELKGSRYRQIVEPLCRVFYRHDGKCILILHVMRSEQLLKPGRLRKRDRKTI